LEQQYHPDNIKHNKALPITIICAFRKRSNIILRLNRRGEFTQTVRVPSNGGEEILPNRHITFIVAEKA